MMKTLSHALDLTRNSRHQSRMSFDLQVNGFAGVDFNSDALTGEAFRHACAEARAHGADQLLATLITDDLSTLERRLRALVAWREQDELLREVVVGFHVEGPFLNPAPGYIGAHPAAHAQSATVEAAERLCAAGGGLVRLVTLAPECDPGCATTRWLAGHGVTVSAGHCDPSLDQLRAAIDSGLSMVTHLGNGCPMHWHRHDNFVQRALSLSDRLWCCFIADGAHVPFFALQNYLRLVGRERAIIVTDATAASSLGPGTYRLGSREVEIGADLIAWAPDRSHLVGSTTTLHRTARDLAEHLGLEADVLTQLMEVNPRRAVVLQARG
jgi:N-acetylglucosamine-6-phosphate deacetylase